MSTMTTDLNGTIKVRAEKIVADGADMRRRLADLVRQSAGQSEQSGAGLLVLIRAVMDGAAEGLARAVPENRDDVLRQVVDAVGDGLSQTALSGQLAVQESASRSRRYAKENLVRLRDDLQAVRGLFTETVVRGLESSKALTAWQIAAAQEHAERVAEGLSTVFLRAHDAIRQHPLEFAQEGLHAGASMGQSAAGAVFQTLGRMLQGDERRRRDER